MGITTSFGTSARQKADVFIWICRFQKYYCANFTHRLYRDLDIWPEWATCTVSYRLFGKGNLPIPSVLLFSPSSLLLLSPLFFPSSSPLSPLPSPSFLPHLPFLFIFPSSSSAPPSSLLLLLTYLSSSLPPFLLLPISTCIVAFLTALPPQLTNMSSNRPCPVWSGIRRGFWRERLLCVL